MTNQEHDEQKTSKERKKEAIMRTAKQLYNTYLTILNLYNVEIPANIKDLFDKGFNLVMSYNDEQSRKALQIITEYGRVSLSLALHLFALKECSQIINQISDVEDSYIDLAGWCTLMSIHVHHRV